jgi:hypothetical protein
METGKGSMKAGLANSCVETCLRRTGRPGIFTSGDTGTMRLVLRPKKGRCSSVHMITHATVGWSNRERD